MSTLDEEKGQIRPEQYGTRNDSLEFARRTRANLEFILAARRNKSSVHPVTQTMNSMLGLLIFPHQKGFDSSVNKLRLSQLYSEGWPRISVTLGDSKTKTLGDLLRHMRNAAAHRKIIFSSDSSDLLQEVRIELSDGAPSVNWRAEVTAEGLRIFAFKLIELLEEFERGAILKAPQQNSK